MLVETVVFPAKAVSDKRLPKSSNAQSNIANCLRHMVLIIFLIPPIHLLMLVAYALSMTSPPFWGFLREEK